MTQKPSQLAYGFLIVGTPEDFGVLNSDICVRGISATSRACLSGDSIKLGIFNIVSTAVTHDNSISLFVT
jgi:hypothetical protein